MRCANVSSPPSVNVNAAPYTNPAWEDAVVSAGARPSDALLSQRKKSPRAPRVPKVLLLLPALSPALQTANKGKGEGKGKKKTKRNQPDQKRPQSLVFKSSVCLGKNLKSTNLFLTFTFRQHGISSAPEYFIRLLG